MKRGSTKFCPRCGAQLRREDVYCTHCGYSFNRRNKLNLRTIIIGVAAIIGLWILIRIITGQPIIPSGFADLFKNLSSNKTG